MAFYKRIILSICDLDHTYENIASFITSRVLKYYSQTLKDFLPFSLPLKISNKKVCVPVEPVNENVLNIKS